MRYEFNIYKYREVIGLSDEEFALLLSKNTWEKACMGKTQEEMPHYIINKQWTIEVPETPKEVCELIIKNGGCSQLPTVDCINCPLNTPDYDCVYDVTSAKKWIKRHSCLSYLEEARKWVAENNIKKGDKVKVSKSWEEGEGGCKLIPFIFLVGATGEFDSVDSDGDVKIVVDDYTVVYAPYFSLKIVKEPTYRPFKSADEFEPYRDKWVIIKGGHAKIITYDKYGCACSTGAMVSYKTAFEQSTFEDGTPFGVKE